MGKFSRLPKNDKAEPLKEARAIDRMCFNNGDKRVTLNLIKWLEFFTKKEKKIPHKFIEYAIKSCPKKLTKLTPLHRIL